MLCSFILTKSTYTINNKQLSTQPLNSVLCIKLFLMWLQNITTDLLKPLYNKRWRMQAMHRFTHTRYFVSNACTIYLHWILEVYTDTLFVTWCTRLLLFSLITFVKVKCCSNSAPRITAFFVNKSNYRSVTLIGQFSGATIYPNGVSNKPKNTNVSS